MQTDGQNFLVLDIGSGSVGVAVVFKGFYDGKNTIKYSNRHEFDYNLDINFESITNKMLITIQNALSKIPKIYIDSVVVNLHSPWHIIQSKKTYIEKAKSFKLTENFIQDISYQETDFLKNSVKDGAYKNLNLVHVESVIPIIKINGYPVREPFGQNVKNCEFIISATFMPKDIFDGIKQVCNKTLLVNQNQINFHSAYISFAHTCSNLYKNLENNLIIDVGFELTDISIINNGLVLANSSFLGGINSLVRSVAVDQKISFTNALGKLHTAFKNLSDNSLNKLIGKNLVNTEFAWQESLSKALAQTSSNEKVPHKIVLVCEDPNFLNFYKQALLNDTLTQYLKTRDKFEIIEPTIEAIKNNVIIEGNNYIDTSLGLVCLAL